ncbi:MAG: carboxypeptidase-like regulatory domain-containing protein, partial [Flavobacteriaceae bacterium]
SLKKMNFSNWKKRVLTSQFRLFEDEKLNIGILKKASKYQFEITEFTYIGDTPVYILSFTPKGSADYQGKLFVDADQMALIRIEYKNIQNIRDLSLFGLSFKLSFREVVLQFKKMESEKYTLEYMEYSSRFQSGIERPLVITEKNKIVKGRNKQNQLKMDLKMTNEQYNKYQIVVFETLPLSQKEFEDLKETAQILPVNLTQYDPTFWEGYSIIEPNAAIKSYKAKR